MVGLAAVIMTIKGTYAVVKSEWENVSLLSRGESFLPGFYSAIAVVNIMLTLTIGTSFEWI